MSSTEIIIETDVRLCPVCQNKMSETGGPEVGVVELFACLHCENFREEKLIEQAENAYLSSHFSANEDQ